MVAMDEDYIKEARPSKIALLKDAKNYGGIFVCFNTGLVAPCHCDFTLT